MVYPINADASEASENYIQQLDSSYFDNINTLLVLQQCSFDEYRAIQSVQDKARVAGNGHSLAKTLNAVLDALGCSLRAIHQNYVAGVLESQAKIYQHQLQQPIRFDLAP